MYTIRSLGRSGPPYQTCPSSWLSYDAPGCTDMTVFMGSTAIRWKLAAVPGKRNTYLVRPALRSQLCPWRYLGAAKPVPGRPGDCGPAAVKFYQQLDKQALIEWEAAQRTGRARPAVFAPTAAAPSSSKAVAAAPTAPSSSKAVAAAPTAPSAPQTVAPSATAAPSSSKAVAPTIASAPAAPAIAAAAA
ncbi:hypothetical protein ABPG75_010314 [Micractinium tetrahymenae]